VNTSAPLSQTKYAPHEATSHQFAFVHDNQVNSQTELTAPETAPEIFPQSALILFAIALILSNIAVNFEVIEVITPETISDIEVKTETVAVFTPSQTSQIILQSSTNQRYVCARNIQMSSQTL
tara:strand:- start:225 stop:593 length:369 start_codon:yes stop_codon:yes gene_type:complete